MATQTSEEKEEKKIHEFLPFWARELLKIKDEAESQHKVHEISEKEDS